VPTVQEIATRPQPFDSAPYFTAFVANSLMAITRTCTSSCLAVDCRRMARAGSPAGQDSFCPYESRPGCSDDCLLKDCWRFIALAVWPSSGNWQDWPEADAFTAWLAPLRKSDCRAPPRHQPA
jgi:hypothetical protein